MSGAADDLFLLHAQALADGRGTHPAGVEHDLLVIVRAATLEDAKSRAGVVFFTQSEWVAPRFLKYGRLEDWPDRTDVFQRAIATAEENGFACVVYQPRIH